MHKYWLHNQLLITFKYRIYYIIAIQVNYIHNAKSKEAIILLFYEQIMIQDTFPVVSEGTARELVLLNEL